MWSWLETPNLKVTDIPSEDVNKIVTGLEEKQKENDMPDLISTVYNEENEENKENNENEEVDEKEAEWEKDLDKKCDDQCNSIWNKKIKFKIQRNHLILLSIAYVANIFLFMFNKKCKCI